MPFIRLLTAMSCLGMLLACRSMPDPVRPAPALSLNGRYQALTFTERPYLDSPINDLVLFDTLTQGCDKQPITLTFSGNGILTTGIAPGCLPHTSWLAEAGLADASKWVVSGSTLVVTPTQGQDNSFNVQLTGNQLELNWQGTDSSFVGLEGQSVTYSLALKRL